MPISVFTGPPGSGKSHALVKDVIVPAVFAGRRVVSNIDGLNPDAVRGYCLERVDDASRLGEVVTFHGEQMLKPGFFPDETTGDQETFVRPGDMVVIDEWALYFRGRGKEAPGCNVEAFLRWHRHLTGPGGQATDVAIGTQVPTDINSNYRAVVSKSYKFRKLTAVGADGMYSYQVFEGHLQPKGGHYRNGTGKYDPEIFPLYASSAAAAEGTHVELRTNAKESIWSSWKAKAFIASFPLVGLVVGLCFYVLSDTPFAGQHAAQVAAEPGAPGAPGVAVAAPVVPKASTEWRIVGRIDVEDGVRVIVADTKGATRILRPDQFEFDGLRPVSGRVEGQLVIAEERLPAPQSGGGIFGGVVR